MLGHLVFPSCQAVSKMSVFVIGDIKSIAGAVILVFGIGIKQYAYLYAVSNSSTKQKDETEVKKEIQGVIRQITASVTFLPLIECPCMSFM